MDIDTAVRILSTLSPEDKVRTLAKLCHDLTVIARDTYGLEGDVKSGGRLRALNEIQHRVTGLLVGLLDAKSEQCPDQYIATMFLARREDEHLAKLLALAFARCCGSTPQTSPNAPERKS